jgi:hypothetical protein
MATPVLCSRLRTSTVPVTRSPGCKVADLLSGSGSKAGYRAARLHFTSFFQSPCPSHAKQMHTTQLVMTTQVETPASLPLLPNRSPQQRPFPNHLVPTSPLDSPPKPQQSPIPDQTQHFKMPTHFIPSVPSLPAPSRILQHSSSASHLPGHFSLPCTRYT